MNKLILSISTIVLLGVSSCGLAADKPTPTNEDLAGRLDLAVPEIPAFAALGVTPENVIRPGSGRDLALGILRGVNANGELQAGLAIETNPYMLANGNELTLKEYQTNEAKRLLARIRLSFATAAGQSNSDNADKTAIAIRWTPWDDGDKRLYQPLYDCFEERIKLPDTPPPDISGGIAVGVQPAPPNIQEAAKKCVTDAEKALWNASSWDIGVAAYRIDDDANHESGFTAWTSMALRVGDSGQFILHGRYMDNLLNKDVNSDGTLDPQDGYIASARLRWGNENAALLLESSYTDVEYITTSQKDKYNDVMLGVEYLLYEDVWVQFAYGDRSGSDLPDSNESYLSGQFKWAFSNESLR